LSEEVPSCDSCGGLIKPNITFFGEPLPEQVNRHIKEDTKDADLVLVIGTSLKVAPVSKIIQMIPHTVPRVLINREILLPAKKSLMGFDLNLLGDFDLNLLGDCDLIVKHLNILLKWGKLPQTEDNKSSVPLVRVLPNCYLFGGIKMSACMGMGEGEESEEVITCDCCEGNLEKNMVIFTCSTCLDFDLCQKCYELGLCEHALDQKHTFQRSKVY